jgi:hypothetical protein
MSLLKCTQTTHLALNQQSDIARLPSSTSDIAKFKRGELGNVVTGLA